MSVPSARLQFLDFFGTPLVIEPSPGQLSSDAGLLPIRQFDQRIGLTGATTPALDDLRDFDLTEHAFLGMLGSRVAANSLGEVGSRPWIGSCWTADS
jgi:hypothetical protein